MRSVAKNFRNILNTNWTIVSFFFWLVFILGIYLLNQVPKVEFEFEVAVQKVSNRSKLIGAIYFDTGRGFNQYEMWNIGYTPKSIHTFNRYSFVIQADTIKRLRFDPLTADGTVAIRNFSYNLGGSKKIELNSKKAMLSSGHSIKEIEEIENGVIISCNGTDPYLTLSNQELKATIRDRLNQIHAISIDKAISGIAALILLSALIAHLTVTKSSN